MHVCISNVYADSNKGGSMLTLAAVQAIRRANPDSSVTLLGLDEPLRSLPETARRLPDVRLEGNPLILGSRPDQYVRRRIALSATSSRVSMLPWLTALGVSKTSAVWHADAVLAKGGQVFRNYPTRRSLRSFRASTIPLSLAQQRGKPTFAYGVQVGPYSSAPASSAARSVMSELSLAVVRDGVSADLLKSWGLDNFVLTPDTIFGVDLPPVDNEIAAQLRAPYAVLTVHNSFQRSEVRSRMNRILTSMRSLLEVGGLQAVYVAHQATSRSERDPEVASDIATATQDPRVLLLPTVFSTEQILGVYENAQFVISGRVHGALMPLLVGTPGVIVDTWSDKGQQIFSTAGFADYVAPLNGERDERLCERIAEGDLGGQGQRDEILRQVRSNRSLVREADELLAVSRYL